MKPDIYEMGNMEAGGQQIALRLIRSTRRKRTVAFSVDPPATLLITAPLKSNLAVIRKMAETRAGWIVRRLAAFRQFEPMQFVDGATVAYLGHRYRLHVTHDMDVAQGCRIRPRHITVNIRDGGMSDENLRQEVRLEIMLWLKKRAKMKLRKRLDLWSKRTGLKYERLILSNPKGRWGSCSAHNVIRLNWRLILAPLPVLDYVAVHELCHVVHKNHRKRFWQSVESVLPDYRLRRKQLRQIGHRLAF